MANISVLMRVFNFQLRIRVLCVGQKLKWIPSLEDEKNNPSFSLCKKSIITPNKSICNLFIELQIFRSVIDMIGVCPDCTSKITLKLINEKHQGFANNMCLICYKCNWTYDFYTSSFISKNDTLTFVEKKNLILILV